jgi:hypothetical protein
VARKDIECATRFKICKSHDQFIVFLTSSSPAKKFYVAAVNFLLICPYNYYLNGAQGQAVEINILILSFSTI